MTAPLSIDIWSDIQCPWCYIGKRKLEAGIAAYGGPVEIEYHSFELAPDTPVDFEGTPVDYLSDRKGIDPDQAKQMLAHVTSIAAEVGLDYHFDVVHQTNTRKAHELLHLAKSEGYQGAMKERLLRAYFIEGHHVGRIDVLADLAAEVGLDRESVRQRLASAEFADAVEADVQQAAAYGITGVPFFVINNKYAISGAQSPEVFAKALRQAADEVSTGA